jgi:DNA-binding transcriptional regulator YhcF (GntR family)
MIYLNTSGQQRDKTVNRVLTYFDDNRDEALSIKDAVIKFDVGHCTVRKVFQDLEKQGILKSTRVRLGGPQHSNVYERAE